MASLPLFGGANVLWARTGRARQSRGVDRQVHRGCRQGVEILPTQDVGLGTLDRRYPPVKPDVRHGPSENADEIRRGVRLFGRRPGRLIRDRDGQRASVVRDDDVKDVPTVKINSRRSRGRSPASWGVAPLVVKAGGIVSFRPHCCRGSNLMAALGVIRAPPFHASGP